jgi:hypothetical protein
MAAIPATLTGLAALVAVAGPAAGATGPLPGWRVDTPGGRRLGGEPPRAGRARLLGGGGGRRHLRLRRRDAPPGDATPFVAAAPGGIGPWAVEDPSLTWLDELDVPLVVARDGTGLADAAFEGPTDRA